MLFALQFNDLSWSIFVNVKVSVLVTSKRSFEDGETKSLPDKNRSCKCHVMLAAGLEASVLQVKVKGFPSMTSTPKDGVSVTLSTGTEMKHAVLLWSSHSLSVHLSVVKLYKKPITVILKSHNKTTKEFDIVGAINTAIFYNQKRKINNVKSDTVLFQMDLH